MAMLALILTWQVFQPQRAQAAPLVQESFTGSVPDLGAAWEFFGDACMTAASSGIYNCSDRVGSPPSGGSGFLQLTSNKLQRNGTVLYNSEIPSAQGLAVEFTQYQYGASKRSSNTRRPADGIGFYLTDGAYDLTTPGSQGGSLGYAAFRSRSTGSGAGEAGDEGIAHGYLGVGLDTFGNFANLNFVGGDDCAADSSYPWDVNSSNGLNKPLSNSVTLRGPGNGNSGYCRLATTKLDSRIDDTTPWSPSLWAGDLGDSPPVALVSGAGRKVRIIITPVTAADPRPTIRVYIDFTGTGSNYPVTPQLQYTMTEDAPENFKFGFSASTGGDSGSHLIGGLQILAGPQVIPDANVEDQGSSSSFDLDDQITPGSSPIASVVLLDPATGNPIAGNSVVVPGEGTWTRDPATNTVTFVPEAGFTGEVTPLGFRATDENGQYTNSTLSVTYRPKTGDAEKTVSPGGTATFAPGDLATVPGSSTDLSYAFTDGTTSKTVAHGTWTIDPATGQTTYVADAGYTGPVDPIDYRVTDGNGETAEGTLSIIMPPIAGDQTVTKNVGETANLAPILTPGSDPTLTVSINGSDSGDPTKKTVPGEGVWTISPTTGAATFVPEAGFGGNPTPIDYTLTDGNGLSDTGTLTVLYIAPPTAGDKEVTKKAGETATLLPLITPGTSTTLTVSLDGSDPGVPTKKTVPGQGVWTIDPTTGAATFVPEAGFTGNPTPVTYTVTDGNNLTDQGTLTVTYTVDPIVPPVAGDSAATIKPGESKTFDPLKDLVTPGSSDELTVKLVDPETGQPTSATQIEVPGEGTWTLDPATGKITFTPESGFTGTTTPLSYQVLDGNNLVDSGKLAVTVKAGSSSTPTKEPEDTDHGGENLAQTGAQIAGTGLGAVGLLGLGGLLVVASRRRRSKA